MATLIKSRPQMAHSVKTNHSICTISKHTSSLKCLHGVYMEAFRFWERAISVWNIWLRWQDSNLWQA